ncbi:hypothetical protein [Pandoraea norimbergensis]|uniref:CopG family transcriptional regulator n=1 Tax=Pandoraea norimbergensis TaxID=93219 RepID=A0ABM5WID8_9BURK|nr:hypothetical protein [Pandoraea norimbergensis]ALS60155.1 hypothetical protein AT302_10645 [Pandoraea norimbergensis]
MTCELEARYEACEDLALQRHAYTTKKICSQGWTAKDVFERIEPAVDGKLRSGEWDLSREEAAWTLCREKRLTEPGQD